MGGVGACGRVWGHVVGCGGMWQGGGRGGGRVWGHVAALVTCGGVRPMA